MYLFTLAIAPVFAIVLYIYARDMYAPEPIKRLVWCFFLGMLSVIPSLGLEALASYLGMGISANIPSTALYAFVGVGFSEEFSKALMLLLGAYFSKDLDEPLDGIVYAVMVSMGFAAVENVMYVYQGGAETAILRMFTAVPAHASFAVLMGFFWGKAKFVKYSGAYLLLGLSMATIFHGAYDFFLFMNDYYYTGFGALVALLIGFIPSYKAIKIYRTKSSEEFWEDYKRRHPEGMEDGASSSS